jgi:hypothetical protein
MELSGSYFIELLQGGTFQGANDAIDTLILKFETRKSLEDAMNMSRVNFKIA